MKNKKTLILIDGHALAFRQYYALERTNMSTSSGTPTWAVFGFFKAIIDILKNKNIKKDAIAVAFDVSHHTFRVDAYEDYKSNRSEMPDAMRVQMELIKKGLQAFNIPIYTKEGYEADDVIGTICKRATDSGHNVLILTGDQDAFQLVDESGAVKVIIPSKGELLTYDWEKVHEKLGVYPDKVVDFKALRGDASDNIPGIYGIGEKTACRLLNEYGTLDNILDHARDITEAAVRNRIVEGIEKAKLSKFLATIVRDVDIDFDFDKACIELPDIIEVTNFLRDMQFYSLLKNINSVMTAFNNGKPCTKEEIMTHSASTGSGQLQLNFFGAAIMNTDGENDYDIELIHTEEQLQNAIDKLSKQSLIAYNIEAIVKDILNSQIIGLTLGFNENLKYNSEMFVQNNKKSKSKIYYIPISHSNIKDQLSLKTVIPMLKPIFEDDNIKKITHNVKTQYGILRDIGIYTKGFVFDTLIASYEANPNRNHELQVQAIENIEHAIFDYNHHEGRFKDQIKFYDAPIDSVKNYTGDYIDTIIRLTNYWLDKLSNAEFKLMNEIDLPLTLVLADMEFAGIAIDLDLLSNFSEELKETISRIETKIYNIAHQTFNLNSPQQVSRILYDKLKLSNRKKKSTSAEILEELAKKHKICAHILEYRKNFKLKNTYIDTFPRLIDPIDNRIHTTFNLTSTTTGRISSSNPNLQNIPVRTEIGNTLRKAFVPGDRENYLILSADYSQIELRILAHVSGDENLIETFNNNIDIHTLTASKVFDVPVEKVTKDMRYKAKAVNFGIIYGQSKYGLAKALSITPQDAESFIERYFQTYPKVKRYMDNTIAKVEKYGYVDTLFGRRRYFSAEIESAVASVRDFARRAAINFPIQGAGADLIKKAMLECHKNMKSLNLKSKMIVQVHDEIVIEVHKDELDIVSKLVKEAMESGQPFKVPLVVDINVGDTWAE